MATRVSTPPAWMPEGRTCGRSPPESPAVTSHPPMPLLPRWRYMTDEAKALTKRTAASALVVLLVLLIFRALVPWALLAVVAWWVWRAFSK